MREIRFRAWDGKGKQMIGHENLMMNCDGFFAIDEEGTEFPMEIIMQFTGLKDKNGKEIYEGDLLARWQYYSGGNGKLCSSPTGEQSHEVKWIARENKLGWNVGKARSWEVIGNIYENPELLT